MQRKPHDARKAGFTLVELVVAVALIGIIMAIAVPQFNEYIRASKRADATGVLTEAGQFMERNFSNTGSYLSDSAGNNVALPAGLTVAPRSASAGEAYYNISFVGTPTDSAFTLQAVPVNSMNGDSCGTFTLTNTGVRAVSGSRPLGECWKS